MSDYLIIGADAAGLSAAVQIKRLQPETDIRIVNKGSIISYGACGIPYVISGDVSSPDNLIHFTPESFAKLRGIPVETGKEAVGLDLKNRVVDIIDIPSGSIEHASFRKLLIATGAEPVKLPFIDYSAPGVFNLHNIEHLNQILSYLEAKKPRRAAIIGAGNIGLELAEALVIRGLEVRIFEVLPDPAGPWPPEIRRAVRKMIEEKGIRFHGGTAVKAVTPTETGMRIETADGHYETEILFSVVGTRPATRFCGNGIEKFQNGALLADRRGRTSHPDIYAAGDCATVYHKLLDRQVYFPLGSTANKMGRIAGMNMAGSDIDFPGIVGTQIFKFFELSLAKTGLSVDEAEKEGIIVKSTAANRTDKAGYFAGSEPVRVRVVYEETGGRIVGAAVASRGNAAQFIDPAGIAVFTGMTVHDLGWFDAAYSPPYAPVWNALISAALKSGR